MAIATFPDFYSWVTQTRGEQVNPDTGEVLRPDQLTGRNYQALQDEYREARFAWEDQSYPEITGPDGQIWAPMLSTTEQGRIPTTVDSISGDPRTQQIFGGKITEHNGVAYAPKSILTSAEVTGSADNGFIQNFMNGPGAVLLPALIVGGAAFAAAGAAGGAGGAATTAGTAGAGGTAGTAGLSAADTLGLYQMGQAAGLSGSGLEAFVASGGTMGSIAAGGGGVGLGATAAGTGTTDVAAGGAMDMTGSAGTGIPGSGAASTPSYATVSGPAVAGGTGTTGTVASTTAKSGLSTLLQSMGVSEGTANTIGGLFPGATLSSLLSGAGQGILGYLGAEKQADAYKSAQEQQNAAIREAIAASERARTEQNAAYGKAYDASVAARGVQNSYIQQSIDEIRRGQASQDAAIQGGIDYSRGASDKYFGLGAPYRQRLEATYQPGYSVFGDSATRDAATQAADFAARGYSATSGNPFDQPTAQGGIYRDVLSQVALPQLNKSREQLGQFGQMGLTQAGAMDQLTTAGLASLGNNDMLAAPVIASLGNNAFQGINYLANQADSGKYTDYLASLGNNAFQGVQNAGSGLNAIGAGAATALNPPLTQKDLMDFFKNYNIKV